MTKKTVNFVDYLGQPLEELLKEESLELVKNEFFEMKGYTPSTFEFKMNREYFGVQINRVSVIHDKKKLIQWITLISVSIVEKHFLEAFINKYTYPTNISKIDKLRYESKSTNHGEFHQELRKRKYSTKEVLLNEIPDFILWKKQNYKIEIRFHYDYGVTQIIFRN